MKFVFIVIITSWLMACNIGIALDSNNIPDDTFEEEDQVPVSRQGRFVHLNTSDGLPPSFEEYGQISAASLRIHV